MEYSILVQKRAENFITSQPLTHRMNIVKAISKLPNGTNIKPIKGQDMYYSLGVDKSRIIYKVEYDIITVIDGGNIG